MEPVKKRMRLIHRQQLDDVPELIQRIQLELPSKDAARTCILSKSWLHAWSTSPAIRFCPTTSLKKQHQRNYMRSFHLTLLRYHRPNLPITSLDLQLGIHTNYYRVARKLIKQAIASSKTSLKELRLAILAEDFTLPDEIFSNENLNTLILQLISPWEINHSLHISTYPDVRCTNLRVLKLSHVHISRAVLNELLSQNKFLEEIHLGVTSGLNEIKVNNLPHLREFIVCLGVGWIDILEIFDAPSLHSLEFYAPLLMSRTPPSLFEISTIGSLRKLQLDNVYMDDAFSNMITSSFPFLEELILEIKWSSAKILDITCLTLRRLMLYFSFVEEIKVQVNAPNLLTYKHRSLSVPILLFTTTPPEQIELSFSLDFSIDVSFFLKMREALKLSSKFNIEMSSFRFGVLDLYNVDDVKTILPHPATNVEELFLQELAYIVSWEHSLLLDAVFSICHPMYAKTNDELRLEVAKYFLDLILKGVMENCEIRNPLDGRWVAVTSSSLNLLDTTTPHGFCEFKLSWCSP